MVREFDARILELRDGAAEEVRFVEDTFNGIALTVEKRTDTVVVFSVGVDRYIRHRPLLLDRVFDRVKTIALVSEPDTSFGKAVHQVLNSLPSWTWLGARATHVAICTAFFKLAR